MRTANLPRQYNTIGKSFSKTSRFPKVECGHLSRLNAVHVTPTTPGLKRTREKLPLNELLLNSAWMLAINITTAVLTGNKRGCFHQHHWMLTDAAPQSLLFGNFDGLLVYLST